MFNHLELQNYDTVRFHSLGGSDLEGETGYILGKYVEDLHGPDYYIVMLDHPFNDRLAVVMTEVCIEKYIAPYGIGKLNFRRQYLDIDCD